MRRVHVGDIIKLQRRKVEVEPAAEYAEIGVRSFGKGIFHKEPLLGIDLGNKRVFEIHPGDLILSNVFAWEGAVGLAQDSERGRIGSHRFMTYTPKSPDVDANYLRHYFTSEFGVEKLGIASPGSAGRNRTLAVERFEAIELTLPDIDEQRRIAEHLDRVRDLATGLTERSNRNTTFSSFVDQTLLALAQDLRGRCPSVPLVEVATWGSGGTPRAKQAAYYDGDIPWAVIGDLTDGDVTSTDRTISELGLAESSAKLVPSGTVLVAMYGSIGKLGIARCEMATNQAIATAQPELVSAEYLFYFLRSIRAELVRLGKGGAQQNISQTILKAVEMPVPERVDDQAVFVESAKRILDIEEQASRLFSRAAGLSKAIFPSALNRAFAGLD